MNHEKIKFSSKTRRSLWRMATIAFMLLFVHLSLYAESGMSAQQQKT